MALLLSEVKEVYYHAGCQDGHSAALAVWMNTDLPNEAFIPVQYGMKPKKAVPGTLIVDFSFPKDASSFA